jgi:hypothetical protein
MYKLRVSAGILVPALSTLLIKPLFGGLEGQLP